MAIDYLGHKRAQSSAIVQVAQRFGRRTCPRPTVADLFCGTCSVASAFAERGYGVVANDTLAVCVAFAEAALLNRRSPPFRRLSSEVALTRSHGRTMYERVLAHLANLPPNAGFFTREYSPQGPRKRAYFTPENAGRIDAIRSAILTWRPLLTKGEYALLRVDLIRAANAVANTAGTYGCYLKRFKARALVPLRLSPATFPLANVAGHEVYQHDANALARTISTDVVYADPPYTKRQYAAYYHILETLAIGDEPKLTGSTGLRPWQDRASAYCYRSLAPKVLADLVNNLRCSLFLLSYSEDGHIAHSDILEILGQRGPVRAHTYVAKRYKSSTLPHRGDSLVERLYVLEVRS